MNAKRLLFGLLLLGLVACGSQSPTNGGELTVFAATSLTDAFAELEQTYEAQNEGVDVVVNTASSSQLAAQLLEGAVADVFASANPTQLQNVADGGRIEPSSATTFVSNRLTVIVPSDNPANLTAFEDVAQPDVALVLAVEGTPIRQYTDQAIGTLSAEMQPQVYANLVSEEDNVRQVAAKIALGEADAAIVYTSDVTPDIADQVIQIPIPDAQNVIATYPIAPLSDAPQPELAQAFIAFVMSDEGQAILQKWGFGAPLGN